MIPKEFEEKLSEKILNELKESTKGMAESRIKKVCEKVYEEYIHAAADAGECVGLVAAESIAEPGTQMSLDYKEKVIIKTNDNITIVSIGEFIDNVMDCFGAKKYGATEVLEFPHDVNLYVPALNHQEKLEWKRITALSRHNAPENLLQIKTRSGRSIIATPYHSFVVRKNNQIIPIAGSELKTGYRIPSVKNLSTERARNTVSLAKVFPKDKYIYGSELKKAVESNSRISRKFTLPLKYEQIHNYAKAGMTAVQEGCICVKQRHGTAQLPEEIVLDESFGWFIGAYLAEGTHTEHYIAITNISEEYLAAGIDFAKRHSINYRIKHDIGEYGRSTSLIMNSTLLAELTLKSCGKLSAGKHVPEFAFSANDKFIGALLQAYFDGDGNISVDREVIRASSNSKELIDGIALLLNRIGIFSTKGTDKKGQHNLRVSYRYAGQFLEKVGSIIPKKAGALQELCETTKETSYDLIEMIPGYGNLFMQLKENLNLPSRLATKLTTKQKIGRNALINYTKEFMCIAQDKEADIRKELMLINQMLSADVVWDEITKLEYIAPTKEKVYDFSVDELETFTTYDGIITHNTLNTFHFAGVSEMNVTVGLPRIIEILDGRKSIETPMMEIYLKHPWNKGKDIRELALSIKETKLKEVIAENIIDIADMRIVVKLDKQKMKDCGIGFGQMINVLGRELKGIVLKKTDDGFALKLKKEGDINELYRAKEKIEDVYIRGIKGIKQVLPVKRGEEFVIITAGSNMKAVLKMSEVDSTRTTTNDIFEIAEVLGIEAARQAIINEMLKVIETQGLNVDLRHIMLVADTMCASGEIKGITRYGVVSEKASVLARASFETPIKHVIDAALVGEIDRLNSVVENVMLNQPVPVGTGLPALITKIK